MQGEGVCCAVKRAVRGLLGSWDWGLAAPGVNGYACALRRAPAVLFPPGSQHTPCSLVYVILIVTVNGDTMSTDAQVRCKGSGLTVLG